MPGKRTNDSVDRILEELGRKQNAEGVRDSVNDRQVDAILESLGMGPVGSTGDPLGPIEQADLPHVELAGGTTQDRFPTAVLDDLLRDLPSARLRTPAAPAPTAVSQPQEAAPTRQQTTVSQPVRQTPPAQEPPQQPEPQEEEEDFYQTQPEFDSQPDPEPTQQTPRQRHPQVRQLELEDTRTGTLGDTTRTGIIKNFLLKMAPEGAEADQRALNQGKKQFQRFFEESAAVVPDEKGRIRPARKKKRGLFGMPSAEDTGEFVPINVSLGGGHPQEEYFPDAPEEEEEEPQERPARQKGGFFAGLFGGRRQKAPEEQPQAPEEETELETGELPPMNTADDVGLPTGELDTGELPLDQPATQPAPAQDTAPAGKRVYRSAARGGDTTGSLSLGGTTIEQPTLGDTRSGTLGRLSTLEFLSGGRRKGASRDTRSNTTVYRKKRDTVEFTPGQRKHQRPEEDTRTFARREGEPVGEPVMTPNAEVPLRQTSAGFTVQTNAVEEKEDTQSFLKELNDALPLHPNAKQPAVTAAQTLTGQVRIEPAAGQTGTVSAQQPHPAEDTTGTLTGQVQIAPATAAQAQPEAAQTGSPQEEMETNLSQAEEVKPDTSEFVHNIAESINLEDTATIGTGAITDQIPGDKDERYARAVDRLLDDSAPEEKKPKRGRIRLGGTPEDEQDGASTEPFDAPGPARSRDYENAEDAPAVRRRLQNQVLTLGIAALVSGILGIAMVYLATAATGAGIPMPGALDPAADKLPLLAVLLVLLAACCGLCWRTMASGLLGLARTPSADSMPALAAAGALVQLLVFLIQPDLYDPTRFCLMAGPAALLLCFNTVGRWLDAGTTADNFQLVSAGVDHAVAYRLKDASALHTITRGLGEPHPCVLVSRPTQLFKGFLASSASRRTSDKNQQQFAWLVAGCSLAAFVFTLIYRKDAGMAVTALATVLCIDSPLAGTLLSALPARLMQRSAAQVGAVVPGWKDIRQLGRINVICVTAKDLFPKGCVKLCGIKPVNKEQRIDLAIAYAASMFVDGSPMMQEVFLGMIGDNRKLLYEVDDKQTVYGKGYVGWIDGERVLVGNRSLMLDYNVKLPSLEYEQRHTVNQRRVIYLAVSGKLFGMFQVAYQRDNDTAYVLDGLRRAGMSLIVDCDDFNCDNALLEAAYGLPSGTVKVLNGTEREAMAPATAWLPESEGNMLHLGSFASFVGGLEAAAGAASGERMAASAMSVSVLFTCVMSIIMVIAGGIFSLPLPVLVLYQAIWAVLALVFPMLQRY